MESIKSNTTRNNICLLLFARFIVYQPPNYKNILSAQWSTGLICWLFIRRLKPLFHSGTLVFKNNIYQCCNQARENRNGKQPSEVIMYSYVRPSIKSRFCRAFKSLVLIFFHWIEFIRPRRITNKLPLATFITDLDIWHENQL